MKQNASILLVDDDKILRDVIFDVLIKNGFQCKACGNGKEAVELLATPPAFDLVVTDIRMPEMDGLELLAHIRKKYGTPTILMTGFSEIAETKKAYSIGAKGFLPKPFRAEDLLATVYECLTVQKDEESAKDLDFARINIDDFMSGKTIPYNIYIRISADHFVRIAHKGIDLDLDQVDTYKKKGAEYLYLHKEDFKNYLQTGLVIVKRAAEVKAISQEKKERLLKHTGELIVEQVRVHGVDDAAFNGAKDFFDVVTDILTNDDDFLTMLDLLNGHSSHLYAHSVGVSLYAIMIARELGWKASPTTFRVGMAGLFHDIGKKEIDEAILNKPRHLLTKQESALLETHTSRGAEILSAYDRVPLEVTQVAVQHHEDPSGFGYPKGLNGTQIAQMSRLIAVANAFCEFAIKNPSHRSGMTGIEALKQMELFNSKSLDPKYFAALKLFFK